MFNYDPKNSSIIGPKGILTIPPGDKASLKMAMLLQGECTDIGPTQAAFNFNYSKSRYYQVREDFTEFGVEGLISKKTGLTMRSLRVKSFNFSFHPDLISSRHDTPATNSVSWSMLSRHMQRH